MPSRSNLTSDANFSGIPAFWRIILKISGYTLCPDEEFDGKEKQTDDKPELHVKTVRITPFDLLLLVISLVLFCTAAIDKSYFSIIALILSAPIYSVFSYRIGNHFSFLIPLLAFIIGFAVTKNAVQPATVVLGAGISFSTLRAVNVCRDRAKSSAVAGSAVSAVIYAFVALIALKLQYGISPSDLLSQLTSALDASKIQLVEVLSSMEPANLGYTELRASDIPALVDLVIEQLLTSLPAVLLLGAMTVGYVSATLTRPIARLCGAEKMFDGVRFEVRLSTVSVFVYFICSLLAIFSDGAFGYGLRNITSLLSPGLLLCGLKQIGDIFRSRNFSKSAIPIVIIAALFIAIILPAGLGDMILTILGIFYCTRYNESYQQ